MFTVKNILFFTKISVWGMLINNKANAQLLRSSIYEHLMKVWMHSQRSFIILKYSTYY